MNYSFTDFIQSDELKRADRIVRDVSLYVTTRIGSLFYDRTGGSFLHTLENSENDGVNDTLIRYNIMQLLAQYNTATLPELQVASIGEMIMIERKGPNINIYIGLVPLQAPSIRDLRLFELELRG